MRAWVTANKLATALAMTLIVVLVLGGVYLYREYREQQEVQAVAEPPAPAEEQAAVDLEPLQSELGDQTEAIGDLVEAVKVQGDEISDLTSNLVAVLPVLAAQAPNEEEPAAPTSSSLEAASTPAPPTESTAPPAQEAVEECLPSLTTEQAQTFVGISVQRIDTECGSWVWRGAPGETVLATCPQGWICTWDVVDDVVVVHEGIGQVAYIYAGTFRQVSAFPSGDAVHNVCELFKKERDLGLREVPSFQVRFQPVEGGAQTCS